MFITQPSLTGIKRSRVTDDT
ncbi:hypothetical protein FAGKG844_310044 [Frankia sp. AgKG'84/4]